MRALWPFSFYFLLFAGHASVGPFFVLYYQGLGFTGAQIGLITGITPLVTLCFAPLWSRIADRTLRHRWIMGLALLCAVAILSVFPLLRAFAPILAIALLLSAVLAPVMPFADNASMFILGDRRELYGRVRLGGTIGYGVAASITGLVVQTHGIRFAFWICAILFASALLTSRKLAHGGVRSHADSGGSFCTVLRTPRWLLFLGIAFAAGMALASFNYLYPYMRELGASESMMGFALTLGTIAEIPVLFFGHHLIRRFRPYGVLVLAMLLTGARLLLFAANAEPSLVLAIQLLNGFTFPLMWVAGVSYAHEMAPEGMTTTAQGLLSGATYGFGMAAGGFLGGPLLEAIGGRGLYLVFGSVTLAITLLIVLLQSRLPALRSSPSGTAP